jgi:hypothetical protein
MRPLSRIEPRALEFLFGRTVTWGDYDIVELSLRAKMDWTAGAVKKRYRREGSLQNLAREPKRAHVVATIACSIAVAERRRR